MSAALRTIRSRSTAPGSHGPGPDDALVPSSLTGANITHFGAPSERAVPLMSCGRAFPNVHRCRRRLEKNTFLPSISRSARPWRETVATSLCRSALRSPPRAPILQCRRASGLRLVDAENGHTEVHCCLFFEFSMNEVQAARISGNGRHNRRKAIDVKEQVQRRADAKRPGDSGKIGLNECPDAPIYSMRLRRYHDVGALVVKVTLRDGTGRPHVCLSRPSAGDGSVCDSLVSILGGQYSVEKKHGAVGAGLFFTPEAPDAEAWWVRTMFPIICAIRPPRSAMSAAQF
jgi:hypothetical protein